jgi:hypothetical protein
MKFCLFRLFQYRSETTKQTKKNVFCFRETNRKKNKTDWVSVCFGSNRNFLKNCFKDTLTVSLPQGWIQEIKRMLLLHLRHGLFLTWTQRFYYITDYILQYLHDNRCLIQPNPLLPTNLCLLGEPASLLVVTNTHPPLSLVCQQLPHPLLALPPFHTPKLKSHYLHRRHQQLQSSLSGTSTLAVSGL